MTVLSSIRVFCVVGLTLCLAALATSGYNFRKAELLRIQGRDARATVTYRALYHETRGDEYDIRYVFPVPGPAKPAYYGQLISVSPARFDRLRENDPLSVRYLPSDPAFSALNAAALCSEQFTYVIMSALGSLALCAGLLAVRAAERRRQPKQPAVLRPQGVW
ncbi:MAG TPA: DUF3592 domain-containing protein [Chthonomonadales bacterium]|nr:DUF3592 domain-containing protein [Chthonomonadales bacterium]